MLPEFRVAENDAFDKQLSKWTSEIPLQGTLRFGL